jgi:hypothetical protein
MQEIDPTFADMLHALVGSFFSRNSALIGRKNRSDRFLSNLDGQALVGRRMEKGARALR